MLLFYGKSHRMFSGKQDKVDSHGKNVFVLRDICYGSNSEGDLIDTRTAPDAGKTSLDAYFPSFININDLDVGSVADDAKRNVISTNNQKSRNVNSISNVSFVIFIHGGGWRRGDRKVWTHFLSCEDTNILMAFLTWYFNLYGNVGECLASLGIACAVISYPLAINIRLPYMCLEILISLLAGCLICAFICGVLMLFFGMFTVFALPKFNLVFTVLLGALCYSHLVLLIMTLRTSAYRLHYWEILTIWVLHICGINFIYGKMQFSQLFLYTISLFSTAFTQLVIFYKRVNLPHVTHTDQINSIINAINWSKTLCGKHCCFGDIFLMGHSAGGHLATLVSLDQSLHKTPGVDDSSRIQGIISICGVYDLKKLSSKFLRHFYLIPAFGEDKTVWHYASPLAHARLVPQTKLPAYLLINAEHDLHLNQDAKKIIEEFSRNDITFRHVLIPGTTHFTIMNRFQRSNPGDVLVRNCLSFINDVQSGCI